jgi:hypothetical protein
MATDMHTTQQILLALAVKEGGWNKPALDHNQPLNNPFGMNRIVKGRAPGDINYPNLNAAITAWEGSHGYVNGVQDSQAFVDALLAYHYNTVNPNYGSEFMGRYGDVGRAMVACGVSP